MRYKFLILCTYHLDNQYWYEQGCEVLQLFFKAQNGSVGKKSFGNTSLKSGKHAAGSEYNENVTLPWSEDYHIMQSLVTSLTKVLLPAVRKFLTSSLRKW